MSGLFGPMVSLMVFIWIGGMFVEKAWLPA